jgi:hypothetical protein
VYEQRGSSLVWNGLTMLFLPATCSKEKSVVETFLQLAGRKKALWKPSCNLQEAKKVAECH